jgi:UDPglucose 6-dehydrogenase
MNILIIGYGVVGKNMFKEFPESDICDPFQGHCAIPDKQYDIAFICVPTPKSQSGACDYSIVEQVIKETKNIDVFCIRSTIPPGTTQILKDKYKARLVFSPEYYGETIHNLTVNFNFITLGGDKVDCHIVANAFIKKHSAEFKTHYTDSLTAELAKYMENCYLGLIVSFCNEISNICQAVGADYNEVREAFLLDPRAPKSHTFVYDNAKGWKSICLDKDIPGLIAFAEEKGITTNILKAIMSYRREG